MLSQPRLPLIREQTARDKIAKEIPASLRTSERWQHEHTVGRYNVRVTLASISRALILLIVTQSESYNSCPCSADEQTEATEVNQLA